MPKTERGVLTTPGGETIRADSLIRIYQLIYFSTSLLPALDVGGRQAIQNILGVATDRNALNGVTGALAFNDLYFAQILEGPYEAVKATYAAILRDPRHNKISILQKGWVDARGFSQWAMASVEDEASMRVISANLQLKDIMTNGRQSTAIALLEMMKFWVLQSP